METNIFQNHSDPDFGNSDFFHFLKILIYSLAKFLLFSHAEAILEDMI